MTRSSVFFICILFHFCSWAGDKVKNGGDVVVCSKIDRTTYEILDLVEAKIQVPPLFHIEAWENKTLDEVNAITLSRLARWNPSRARLYQSWLNNFMQEVRWLPSAVFTDLADEGGGKIYPKNCELKQAVLQWRIPDFGGSRYQVNRDLWDNLTGFQKSVLIFHELIYRELTQDDRFTEDSSGVRYFNAYLHSEEFEESHLRDYFEALQHSGLKNADVGAYPILLNSGDQFERKEKYNLMFHNADHVLSATIGSEFTVRNDFKTQIKCADSRGLIKAFFSTAGTEAVFVSDCKMQITLQKGSNLAWAMLDRVELASAQEVIFGGLVNNQWFKQEPTLYFEDSNYKFIKRSEFKIFFWPTGQVKALGPWRDLQEMAESYLKIDGDLLSLRDFRSEWYCLSEHNLPQYPCSPILNGTVSLF